MTKRRTKKQKIKARERKHIYKYKPEEKITRVQENGTKKLIIKDLLKTVSVTIILIGLLMGIFIFLN